MSSTPVKTDAFLLRTVDYRDSDRILTLLTANKGKISALARGARKSQKRYGGALIPFAQMEVVLEKGRGKLLHIKEAELTTANEGIAKDLRRLGASSYIIEIIRESIPENLPDQPIFRLLETALPLLATIALEDVQKAVIAIVLKILSYSGIAVGLSNCSACDTTVPPGRPVLFHPGRGGVICTPCGGGPIRLEAETIDSLIRLRDTSLDKLSTVPVSPEAASGADEALATFVEHHLGRRLKTRAFLHPAVTTT